MGEACKDALRVDFDRLVKPESHGSTISSDGGLFAYRQLDEAFGTKGVERAPAEVIRESIVFRDGVPTVNSELNHKVKQIELIELALRWLSEYFEGAVIDTDRLLAHGGIRQIEVTAQT